jgi:hypothetical protein
MCISPCARPSATRRRRAADSAAASLRYPGLGSYVGLDYANDLAQLLAVITSGSYSLSAGSGVAPQIVTPPASPFRRGAYQDVVRIGHIA